MLPGEQRAEPHGSGDIFLSFAEQHLSAFGARFGWLVAMGDHVERRKQSPCAQHAGRAEWTCCRRSEMPYERGLDAHIATMRRREARDRRKALTALMALMGPPPHPYPTLPCQPSGNPLYRYNA